MRENGRGFWLLIAILVVVHFVLHVSFGIGAAAPDLLTVAVLLSARQLSGGAAAGVGFALGLLEDAVSLGAFGAAAATQTVIGFVGARSRDLFMGESVLFLGLYLFLGAWVQDALYYGLAEVVRRGDPLQTLLLAAPMGAAYAAVAGLVAVAIHRTFG
ncbi:MAG: rod shape-determining protein MreD [Gemmatimonadetes bacterium]|nr:rod shape-determining protein MreD [Gemmatimonadota bacterium]NIQ59137.1 rod shape-determining protein MreD [Gemmatimonadota bacterium]NIU79341.1 rod shape-determining protein MreD [Gammaproteobacteria bacterium]NIX48009.1 rod shape-determining protein MreD [Gemmatimonadota bacterium]NIY07389.1 rod shape-determining protein MreD [Gemmatimonadota bacterium]